MKRSKIIELDAIANRMEKTLKVISRASTSAARLKTSVIYGSLGFCLGAGGGFAALAAASMIIYAPFIVPLLSLAGLLTGILISRDKIDRTNERSAELVEQAWAIREKDLENLSRQIELVRHEQSPSFQLLEQKRAILFLARPDQLVAYYGLSSTKARSPDYHAPALGPTEQQILKAWESPKTELSDLRNTQNTS